MEEAGKERWREDGDKGGTRIERWSMERGKDKEREMKPREGRGGEEAGKEREVGRKETEKETKREGDREMEEGRTDVSLTGF